MNRYETRQAIVEAYLEGLTYNEIVQKYNVTETLIARAVSAANIPKRSLTHKISQDDHPEIIRLYKAGASLRALSLQYNCSSNTIKSILLRYEPDIMCGRGQIGKVDPARVAPKPVMLSNKYNQHLKFADKFTIGTVVKTPNGKATITQKNSNNYLVQYKSGNCASFTLWELWKFNYWRHTYDTN